MTDSYLRSLGFAPADQAPHAARPSFSDAWRYRHEHMAQDGTPLFIEHALGIDGCRLSAVEAPLAAADVFASVPLLDKAALQTAVDSFFAAHGGMGSAAPVFVPHSYLPYRRQR